MKNIVLVGFMGSGKTTISQLLAAKLGKKVFSTDDLIVEREARPITAIFKDSGEPYFRRVEKEVVAEVAQKKDAVIDCGGGVVLDPENVSHLKKTGTVFYLSATPEAIYNRIKEQTHRPLLHTPDPLNRIRELLDKRRAFYEQADYTIDTNDDDWSRICDEIVGIVAKKAE